MIVQYGKRTELYKILRTLQSGLYVVLSIKSEGPHMLGHVSRVLAASPGTPDTVRGDVPVYEINNGP